MDFGDLAGSLEEYADDLMVSELAKSALEAGYTPDEVTVDYFDVDANIDLASLLPRIKKAMLR